jgi:hypothetical protein
MKPIEMGKKCRFRDPEVTPPVRILCTDAPGVKPVIVLCSDGSIIRTYADGKVNASGEESPYDLIEVSEWEDFKIDEPVMVKLDSHMEWCKRYYAGADDKSGKPTTFIHGATSWTNEGFTPVGWDYCRRPTEEELELKG